MKSSYRVQFLSAYTARITFPTYELHKDQSPGSKYLDNISSLTIIASNIRKRDIYVEAHCPFPLIELSCPIETSKVPLILGPFPSVKLTFDLPTVPEINRVPVN